MRTALVLCAVVGLMASVVLAEETEKVATLTGTVVKVDGTNVVVQAGEKEVTVATDENTTVTVDGKAAKLTDLQPKMDVVVTPAEGVAAKIEATTPKTAE